MIRFPAQRAFALSVALLVAVLLAPAAPSLAHATVQRTTQPSNTPTNAVRISPPRIELDVQPGKRKVEHISITNDSKNAQDVTLTPTDFGASSDPREIGHAVQKGEFGAGDWITPEISKFRLAPFERIEFDVFIDPPNDAPSGTNLGGLRVRTVTAAGAVGASDGATPVVVDGLVEIFLTVAGPVSHKLRITDVRTHDSYNFGSNRLVSWDVSFKNDGTVNEHVEGTLDVKSIFGTRAARIKIDPLLVLRGSTRTQRIIWHDVPWIGAFTPEANVRGDDARTVLRSGSRTVIVPWWIFPLIALLIVVPTIWLWISRRRAWALYLDDDDDEAEEDHLGDAWDPAGPPAT